MFFAVLENRAVRTDLAETVEPKSGSKSELTICERGLLTRPWDRIQFAKSRFALGRGASAGVYPLGYSTQRATKPQGKTALARRVAALLACGCVARRVTERAGYAPLLAPCHKPKSPATNCILSHGLVSMTRRDPEGGIAGAKGEWARLPWNVELASLGRPPAQTQTSEFRG